MTAAELDTRRRMLGLSIADQALICGDVQEKTVRGWNSGARPIPADVIDTIDRLESEMNHMVDRIVLMATHPVKAGPVRLVRFRTQDDLDRSPHNGWRLGAHAMVIGWASDALAAQKVDAVVEWSDV